MSQIRIYRIYWLEICEVSILWSVFLQTYSFWSSGSYPLDHSKLAHLLNVCNISSFVKYSLIQKCWMHPPSLQPIRERLTLKNHIVSIVHICDQPLWKGSISGWLTACIQPKNSNRIAKGTSTPLIQINKCLYNSDLRHDLEFDCN